MDRGPAPLHDSGMSLSSAPLAVPQVEPVTESEKKPAFVAIPSTEELDDELHIRAYGTKWSIEWEAAPSWNHQLAVDTIRDTLHAPGADSGCDCFDIADVDIWFAEGTWRRPDISIWCHKPELPPEPEGEGARALTIIPDAIVEVVSHSSKKAAAKDLDPAQNPALYLSAGVRDVLVFDPRARRVYHHTGDGMTEHPAGTEFFLRCGCTVTV